MTMRPLVGLVHAYPGTFLLESLLGGGYDVLVVAPSDASVPDRRGLTVVRADLSDEERVIQLLVEQHHRRPFAALLPVYEGSTPVTARAAARLGLRGGHEAAALASRNKYEAYRLWRAAGVACPDTLPVHDDDLNRQRLEDGLGYPMILKPTDSMNSQGVCLVRNREELKRHAASLVGLLAGHEPYQQAWDRNRIAYGRSAVKIIAQRFCSGREVGVDLLLRGDDHVCLGIFEKACSGGPHFAETMSVTPSSLGRDDENAVIDLALRAVRALGACEGAAHVEIRFAAGAPLVIEAGLRPGGGYTAQAVAALHGFSPYAALAALLAQGQLPVLHAPMSAALYGGVLYPSSGVLSDVTGDGVLDEVPGLVEKTVLHQVGEVVAAPPNSAQPHYVYYLLRGPSAADLCRQHDLIQSSIKLTVRAFA